MNCRESGRGAELVFGVRFSVFGLASRGRESAGVAFSVARAFQPEHSASAFGVRAVLSHAKPRRREVKRKGQLVVGVFSSTSTSTVRQGGLSTSTS